MSTNSFLAILFILTPSLTYAQSFKEGKITAVQKMEIDDPDMQSQFDQAGVIRIITYVKGHKSRIEQKTNDGITTTIMNWDMQKGITLIDHPYMGKKYVWVDEETFEQDEDQEGIEVIRTSETMDILGYDCIKYYVKIVAEGQRETMKLYVTEDIILENQEKIENLVTGLPLYWEKDQYISGALLKVTMQVTEISEEHVSPELFQIKVPEGYEEMDWDFDP